MRRSLGSGLGLAALVWAVVTGPITHVHPEHDGHAAVWHAHVLSGHPAESAGRAAFLYDDDDDHTHVVYVNPYVSVEGTVAAPVVDLTPGAVAILESALPVGLASMPTEQAHGPPPASPTVLRGPPVRPSSV